MTAGSYHNSVPTRPQRRRKPDPQRVYETYLAERAIDEWGAFTRTAARYHKADGRAYSPEWARKLCKAYEEQLERPAPELPEELAYVPPPGGFPEPEPAAILPTLAEESAESPAGENTDFMSSLNGKLAEIPTLEVSNSVPSELEIDTPEPPQPLPDPLPDPIPDPVPVPVPPMPGPNPARPIIIRQVVRVPVERRGGAVAWLQEHEAASKQLVGLLVLLGLIVATWLG